MAAVHVEPELENAYKSGHVLEVEPHFNSNYSDQVPLHGYIDGHVAIHGYVDGQPKSGVPSSSLPAFAVLAAMAATGLIILALAAFIRQLRAKDVVDDDADSVTEIDEVISTKPSQSTSGIPEVTADPLPSLRSPPRNVKGYWEGYSQESLGYLPDIRGHQIPGIEQYFPKQKSTFRQRMRHSIEQIPIFGKRSDSSANIPKEHLENIYVY
ncbi:unnamed protein product [Cyprideis torosa]|uniref:Uncharacterized protein n=1 Tax=Cyprideis torosa TaxID=163714 RepID=A0A7R8WHW9_9CRUS|nr:unnamed protein product [Cyprideis torosa]CAG0897109.1 unnamed protein product [Cyprideis torosa]